MSPALAAANVRTLRDLGDFFATAARSVTEEVQS